MTAPRPLTLRIDAPPGAAWARRPLPAAALRGALRAQLEALIRGATGPGVPTRACTGGDGVDPLDPGPAPEGAPCALDRGRPCAACATFGARHSLASPALTLGPARPDPAGHLTATGSLSDPDGRLTGWLKAACTLTAALGPAHPGVRLSLRFEPAPPLPLQPLPASIRLTATLTAPARLGRPGAPGQTRRHIPGSALRGALATWLAARGLDADAACHPETGARFGPLVPGDPAAPFLGPWPLTARRCAADPSHPPQDEAFDRLAAHLAASPGEEAAVEAWLARRSTCACCGAPMIRRRGFRGAPPVPTTFDAHGQEQLPAGLQLTGELHALPSTSRHDLAAALAAPLSFGAGRSRAAGAVQLTWTEAPPPPPLAERAARFHAALRDRLRAAGLAPDRAERCFALTLQTPLMPPEDPEDLDAEPEAALLAALAPLGCTLHLQARRFGTAAHFSRRAGGPQPPRLIIQAGAVYLFETAADPEALHAALAALEAAGVGDGRHLGFGRLIAFDPALFDPAHAAPPPGPAPKEDAPMAHDLTAAPLVAAAEALVADAAAGALGPRPLTRLPLARLADRLAAAGSHAEAANHLRAAAAHPDGGWSPPLVTALLDALEASPDFTALDEPARLARWRLLLESLANALAWREATR